MLCRIQTLRWGGGGAGQGPSPSPSPSPGSTTATDFKQECGSGGSKFSNVWQKNWQFNIALQRAKKVVSDSPGLVEIAIGLVNSVFNLPNGQVMLFEEFE